MKYFLLILLVVCILIGFSLKDKVIVVQLVIPNDLLPYYEWLISFPGVKRIPITPSQEKFPSYNTYHL